MNTRFVVAKYIPDLRRMEPRNIGIIVWHKGATASRFLGEDEATGELHSPPRRISVKDNTAYRQWVESWRMQLTKPFIETGHGDVIKKTSPEYLKQLCEWSRGNYVLVDGGEVPGNVQEDELTALADYLFQETVAVEEERERKEYEYARLNAESIRLMKTTGIAERPDFVKDASAWYKIHGVQRYVKFDFALGGTALPDSVFHRVLLTHQKSFDSEFLHIDWFIRSRKYDRSRFAALVIAPFKETKEQKENRALLETTVTVVNLADERAAHQQLVEIASAGARA
jgi:hypothetical protein